MKTYKSLLVILGSSITVMLLLPFICVQTLRSDAGMAIVFLLFFAVNPVFVICAGCIAGRHMKKLWFAPAIPALVFLLSVWILFEIGEPSFLLYAGVYLLLGILAMLAAWMIGGRTENMK